MIANELNTLMQMVSQGFNSKPSYEAGSDKGSFNDMLNEKVDSVSQDQPANEVKPQDTQENVKPQDKPIQDVNGEQIQAPTDEKNEISDEALAEQQALIANLLMMQNAQPQEMPITEQPVQNIQQIEQPVQTEVNIPMQEVQSEPIADVVNQPQQNIVSEQSVFNEQPIIDEQTVKPEQPIVNEQPQTANTEQPKIVQPEQHTETHLDMNNESNELMDDGNISQEDASDTQLNTAIFKDVQNTVVKVAENTEVVDTKSPNMQEDMADIIKYQLKNVGDKVEIQLNPSNLGKITIELAQNDGTLSLIVHTENSKTLSLISQNLSGLESILQERTGQAVQIHVEENPQQQNEQYDGSGNEKQDQQQQKHENKRSQDEHQNFVDQLRLGLFQMNIENM